MIKELIQERVSKLRTEVNVSARDLSLSLGMSENYINHLENGKLTPSLEVLDYLFDYFKLSPKDFFDDNKTSPLAQNKLIEATAGLQNTQIENLTEIARGYKMLNNAK